jgi:hypothetical protein
MSNLTETYIPFDAGPGVNATLPRWRSMSRDFQWNGIIPGFATQFAATIAVGVITIQPGAVWVDGFYGETTINHTVSSAGLGPGLVVLRADPAARTIGFFYLPGAQGTVLPHQPAPNVSTGTYEIPLYYITTATAFNDVRQWATATNDNYRPPVPTGPAGANATRPYSNSNYCARGRLWRYGAYSTSTALNNYGFDTVSFGAEFFSSYIFYCPYSDDYFVKAQIGFVSTGPNQWANVRIVHGSTVVATYGCNAPYAGNVLTLPVSDIVACKGGDPIYIQHWCSTTGLQGLTGMDRAFFSVRALSR